MYDFLQRNILYTGGAGGLGTSGTLAFLDHGATVVVLDRDERQIGKLQIEAANRKGRLITQQIDLSDGIALRECVSQINKDLGGIDTLINNAAIYPSKPFGEYSLEDFQIIQKVNVEAGFVCAQAVLPGMQERKFGRIVNITSITFHGGWSNLAPYVSSKGALLGLSRSWAREYGAFGITSNCVAPGAFPTEAEKIHPNPLDYAKFVLDHQAIKRRGNPTDVANALLFLTSRDSGFITGQTLNVDGGWVMQ